MEHGRPSFGGELVAAALGGCNELEFIGAGRFGETYRVVRGADEFAVKVCNFEPCMPQRWWDQETEALQRVAHPNVMRFRSAGRLRLRERTWPYMECEYIPGGDVGHRIEVGSLPETHAQVRKFLLGMLAGLKELHDLGILHRDMRPSNVVPRAGDWTQPVLLDFGLAQSSVVSPAHQRLSLASRRADLVAAAAVVYEAGTGRHPDYAEGDAAGRRAGRSKKLPPRDPREVASTFDDDVADLVLGLLTGGRRRTGADEALRELGAA